MNLIRFVLRISKKLILLYDQGILYQGYPYKVFYLDKK